ncbi:hypothetical protein HYG81_19050 (plasmid) [Natrinema zhouii]|uniref:hypothetical protein n=1 Tax=Natrinema zhouii TaxID=1710539 RepID=UPI001CFFAFA4|nr:hypothetical protein [Natrinema zhouii]UHQ98198.1 hypothetical protein HYG81_19050 [Natrinema zhouii]
MSSEDPSNIELGDVAAILFDEFGRSSTMDAKTFHKTTYFIEKKINDYGGDFVLPYFWYKFGTMTLTQNSPVTIQYDEEESEVLCSKRTSDLSLTAQQEDIIRNATQDVLEVHNDIGTEGLTETMYEEAPYDAQRKYRKLDDFIQWQLYKKDESETSFERDEIHRYVNEFIDAFPENEYPQYVNELYLWYDLLSNRLNDSETTLGDIEELVEIFWSIFTLELAVNIDTGLSKEEVQRELGIGDLVNRKQYFRNELHEQERKYLYIEDESPHLVEAADTVMASQLDFTEVSAD